MAVFNLNFTWMTKIQHIVLFRCRYILISYFLFCFIFSEDCIILLKLVSICILNTLNQKIKQLDSQSSQIWILLKRSIASGNHTDSLFYSKLRSRKPITEQTVYIKAKPFKRYLFISWYILLAIIKQNISSWRLQTHLNTLLKCF